MPLDPISSYLLGKVVDMLPARLRRRVLPPAKAATKIEIDLRGNNPINFNLMDDMPQIAIYFRIANRSGVDVVLDRLLFELWVGQPVVDGAVLERYELPSGDGSRDDIFFRGFLSDSQKQRICRHLTGQLLDTAVALTFTAYFESPVGIIRVHRAAIERHNVPCFCG